MRHDSCLLTSRKGGSSRSCSPALATLNLDHFMADDIDEIQGRCDRFGSTIARKVRAAGKRNLEWHCAYLLRQKSLWNSNDNAIDLALHTARRKNVEILLFRVYGRPRSLYANSIVFRSDLCAFTKALMIGSCISRVSMCSCHPQGSALQIDSCVVQGSYLADAPLLPLPPLGYAL